MFLSDWTLAALRFAGILGPSVAMQDERARQSGAVLKYVDNERGGTPVLDDLRLRRHANAARLCREGGHPELADDFIARDLREDEVKERLSKLSKPSPKLSKPSREALLKQLKDEAYAQGRNEEISKLKLKFDLELQENAKRIEAEVRQQVIAHSVKICDLCAAAGESRMMATWVGQGLPLPDVAANLHKEIAESREIHEPVRANRVVALVEAEVRLGLRATQWGELKVC